MFKKLPLKNIIIVSSAILVVPVMAFAMTMTANPIDGSYDKNSNIKITSDEELTDAASAATSLLTSGALGYLDAATSATGKVQTGQSITNDAITSATGNPATTGQGTSADAVSSATSNPGATGSIQGDDDQYEDEEEDDDDEGDDD